MIKPLYSDNVFSQINENHKTDASYTSEQPNAYIPKKPKIWIGKFIRYQMQILMKFI